MMQAKWDARARAASAAAEKKNAGIAHIREHRHWHNIDSPGG
jgi:hypothetical protein